MILSYHPLSDRYEGTIRGDYALAVGRNICHGSDAVESAEKEIKLCVLLKIACQKATDKLIYRWFAANEVVQYDNDTVEKWVFE